MFTMIYFLEWFNLAPLGLAWLVSLIIHEGTKVVSQTHSRKTLFQEILNILQENVYVGVSFLIKLPGVGCVNSYDAFEEKRNYQKLKKYSLVSLIEKKPINKKTLPRTFGSAHIQHIGFSKNQWLQNQTH